MFLPRTSSVMAAVKTGSSALTTFTNDTEPSDMDVTVANCPSPWNAATCEVFFFGGGLDLQAFRHLDLMRAEKFSFRRFSRFGVRV